MKEIKHLNDVIEGVDWLGTGSSSADADSERDDALIALSRVEQAIPVILSAEEIADTLVWYGQTQGRLGKDSHKVMFSSNLDGRIQATIIRAEFIGEDAQ